jgi:iron complex transport system substrate-binding protein
MAAGNWIPSLVELAGGVNLFSMKGYPSPWLKAESLISADPDIIIVMACGFNIERATKELKAFFKNKEFENLKAMRNKQFFITDANHFFIRPGPRIVDSLKILCEIIHPDKFHPTYKGRGWENYDTDA